jgi:hypothetical protein
MGSNNKNRNFWFIRNVPEDLFIKMNRLLTQKELTDILEVGIALQDQVNQADLDFREETT